MMRSKSENKSRIKKMIKIKSKSRVKKMIKSERRRKIKKGGKSPWASWSSSFSFSRS
jgi:hypothetical protein